MPQALACRRIEPSELDGQTRTNLFPEERSVLLRPATWHNWAAEPLAAQERRPIIIEIAEVGRDLTGESLPRGENPLLEIVLFKGSGLE
ncbi:MAG: hypothetical protein MZV63_06610 [Marinilabiliales bacterium]|nr:hypothetical protein [Marinilabiliales bacterium]